MSHDNPLDDFMSDLRRFFLQDLILKAQTQIDQMANADESKLGSSFAERIRDFSGSTADAQANDFVLLPRFILEGLRQSESEGVYRFRMFLQGLVEFARTMEKDLTEDPETFSKIYSQYIKPNRSLRVFSCEGRQFILPEGDVTLSSEKMIFHSYPFDSAQILGFLTNDDFVVPVLQWSALKLPIETFKKERFLILNNKDQSIALCIDEPANESISVSQDIIESSSQSRFIEFEANGRSYLSLNLDRCLKDELDKFMSSRIQSSVSLSQTPKRKQAA